MKSFMMFVAVAAIALLQLGLCPTAQAQQKTEESFNGLFRQHDNAILKMVAVMHLRREANDLRREKITWAKEQIKLLYGLNISLRLGDEKSKAAAIRTIDTMEKNLGLEPSSLYSREIFPLLAAVLRKQEIAQPTALQRSMLSEVADEQSEGQRFFLLTTEANRALNREREAIDVQQEELEGRILLFEGLFKKRK